MDLPSSVTFNPATDVTLEIQVLSSGGEGHVHSVLVYKMSYLILGRKRLSRPFTVIDAQTGEVLDTWEGLTLSPGHRSRRDSLLEDGNDVEEAKSYTPKWRFAAYVKKQLSRQSRKNRGPILVDVVGEGKLNLRVKRSALDELVS